MLFRSVMKRRAPFARARIFLPRVTWMDVDASGARVRRPLDYESDVLSAIDWGSFDAGQLLAGWAPAPLKSAHPTLPDGLDPHWIRLREGGEITPGTLNRVRLTRALIDIAPNPWWVWPWVESALAPLVPKHDEASLAASTASMIEKLRASVEAERDRLAETCFSTLTAAGRIEFSLRADAADYELPMEVAFEVEGRAEPLTRDDARVVEKSLLEPFLRNGLNEFEGAFACYLDDRAAVQWWHRNVARRQYGLQG